MIPKAGGAGKTYSRPATTVEVLLRCLAVIAFFYFIFFIVPRLGPHCRSSAPDQLKTLDDLHNYLQLLAEEHAHDPDKAKDILSLIQQLGSTPPAATISPGGRVSNPSNGLQATTNTTTLPSKQHQQHADVLAMLDKSRADLAAAKLVIKKHEELLQKQVQVAAALRLELQTKQQQQQPQSSTSQAAPGAPCTDASIRALAIAGDACGMLHNAELGGKVVVWGVEHTTSDAGECCAACLAHNRAIQRGVGSDAGSSASPCNVWVFCQDGTTCGERFRQCWLKHEANLGPVLTQAATAAATAGPSMWVSGAINPGQPAALWQQHSTVAGQASSSSAGPASSKSSGTAVVPQLVWWTPLGVIRVKLLPELAPGSVRELLRMGELLSTTTAGRCSNCRIYRAEKGFLIQGIVEAPGAYVAVPRHPNPAQRRVMGRGLVCWAGGGGGPDWFVNLIDQAGFGDQHLCFGQVDESGLRVFEQMLELPVKSKGGPDSVEMTLLQQDIRFNFTLSD